MKPCRKRDSRMRRFAPCADRSSAPWIIPTRRRILRKPTQNKSWRRSRRLRRRPPPPLA